MIHIHQYKVVDSKRREMYDADYQSGRPLYFFTDILYQCSICGKYKTRTIKGGWDIPIKPPTGEGKGESCQ